MQWVIFYNELNRCLHTSNISIVLNQNESDPLECTGIRGNQGRFGIQITLVLVFIISRYWFKSIIRVPP